MQGATDIPQSFETTSGGQTVVETKQSIPNETVRSQTYSKATRPLCRSLSYTNSKPPNEGDTKLTASGTIEKILFIKVL